MNIITLASLSFGMAMDSFAIAVAKGARNKNFNIFHAFFGGLFFGVVEGFAPYVGYYIGKAAHHFVQMFDHWLAFGLLLIIGSRFIVESFNDTEKEGELYVINDNKYNNFDFKNWLKVLFIMLMTAIATSVDSVVVGFSLAFLDVNIYIACIFIGSITTLAATFGLYLGSKLGLSFGKYAIRFGGFILIVIGVTILITHLCDID